MSTGRQRKLHRWTIDFTGASRPRNERLAVTMPELPSPVGWVSVAGSGEEKKEKDADANLVVKKSWDIALGPIKQIPMNVFIMWMAGNTISIFPIMMVGMMFFRPIQALIAVQNTFKMIEGQQAALQKLVYLLGNLICLGLAVYKCKVMGLLPTEASDWLAFKQAPARMEWSGGGSLW